MHRYPIPSTDLTLKMGKGPEGQIPAAPVVPSGNPRPWSRVDLEFFTATQTKHATGPETGGVPFHTSPVWSGAYRVCDDLAIDWLQEHVIDVTWIARMLARCLAQMRDEHAPRALCWVSIPTRDIPALPGGLRQDDKLPRNGDGLLGWWRCKLRQAPRLAQALLAPFCTIEDPFDEPDDLPGVTHRS